MLDASRWPKEWQDEAIEALTPYINTDYLVEVLVGDPADALSGTLLGGYLYTTEDGDLRVIHDHSGRADVHPWRLLMGPVLKITVRRPKKRRTVVFEHPSWPPESN